MAYRCFIFLTAWVALNAAGAGLEFEGAPALTGMKCTASGAPTDFTGQLAYLDHFVLDFKLKGEASNEKLFVAAWFGQISAEQLKVQFAKESARGKPYEILDSAGKAVPPIHAENAKAIAFHPEASNKAPKRADLSKGIGGAPVPLIAAQPGTMRLYSSMHQRFSFSLVGLAAKHFKEFGARYSIEQIEALPAGLYHLRLPFTIAIIDSNNAVRAVTHGERSMTLDLSESKRAATIESFKGSGSPVMIFEKEK